MKGYWQRTHPDREGWYYTAFRDGSRAGLKQVLVCNGQCYYAGGQIEHGADFRGWWWSEPVEGPPAPPTESY